MSYLQHYVRQVRPRNESYIPPVDKIQAFLSEAFNIPLASEEDIDAFDTDIDKGNLKKLLKYVKPLIKSTTSADIPLVGGGSGTDLKKVKIRGVRKAGKEAEVKEFLVKTFGKDNIKGIAFGQGKFGKGGTKISENTQEIMVATLCLMNKTFDSSMGAVDANQLIEDAKKLYNSVEGASLRPDLLEQFNGNYKDLGTAISSANAIKDIVGTTNKVYWTGKGWHSDISHLNPKVKGIKDYNSSDIVVKSGSDFYGFSLKKKAKSKDVDPTLINKPITGPKSFLTNILSETDVSAIEDAKMALFRGIIKSHFKKTAAEMRVINKLPWSKRGKAPEKPNSITRYLKDIPKKVLDSEVKSPKNTFFKAVDTILMSEENAEKFIVDFIKFVLKFDMNDILKDQIPPVTGFHFYLLTGIGDKSGEDVVSEEATVKELNQTIAVLNELFKTKLKLIRTKGRGGIPKLNAYEEGATAAKNFYTITSEGKDILDIEIRYKGEYTANPQFQCNVTVNFKNLFKE